MRITPPIDTPETELAELDEAMGNQMEPCVRRHNVYKRIFMGTELEVHSRCRKNRSDR